MNTTNSDKANLERFISISTKAHDSLLEMTAESEGKKPRIVLAGYG